MELTATQYLMTKLNASHFEDSRDEFTNTWEIVGGIIESYHQAKLKNSCVIGDFSSRLSSSLGECIEGNDYEIVADKDGRFWINHKIVGSGEPLEQWIDSVLNVR